MPSCLLCPHIYSTDVNAFICKIESAVCPLEGVLLVEEESMPREAAMKLETEAPLVDERRGVRSLPLPERLSSVPDAGLRLV